MSNISVIRIDQTADATGHDGWSIETVTRAPPGKIVEAVYQSERYQVVELVRPYSAHRKTMLAVMARKDAVAAELPVNLAYREMRGRDWRGPLLIARMYQGLQPPLPQMAKQPDPISTVHRWLRAWDSMSTWEDIYTTDAHRRVAVEHESLPILRQLEQTGAPQAAGAGSREAAEASQDA